MAIAGVGSVAASLTDGLAREGRVILGGDLAFTLIQREIAPNERTFLQTHGQVSSAATLRAMARVPNGQATLVEMKAVDAAYPLFGQIKLDPSLTLANALAQRDGAFGAVSNACNHVGGPLGEGRLDGDYVTCPWHQWKFHRATGKGEPGFEEDAVPAYPLKVENGRVLTMDYPAAAAGLHEAQARVKGNVPRLDWDHRTAEQISPQTFRTA